MALYEPLAQEIPRGTTDSFQECLRQGHKDISELYLLRLKLCGSGVHRVEVGPANMSSQTIVSLNRNKTMTLPLLLRRIVIDDQITVS